MNELKDIYTSTYNEAGRCEHGEAAQRILHLFWSRIEPWVEKLEREQSITRAELISSDIGHDLCAEERDQWREVAKELATHYGY